MPRTTEQKEADEALRQAIWGVIEAMPVHDGEPSATAAGVLTKFMVIAVQVNFSDDGKPQDSTSLIYSDGAMLGYEAEGLIKQADRIFAQDERRRSAGDDE